MGEPATPHFELLAHAKVLARKAATALNAHQMVHDR